MAMDERNKCAHLPCQCSALPEEKYCSRACKDAGRNGRWWSASRHHLGPAKM